MENSRRIDFHRIALLVIFPNYPTQLVHNLQPSVKNYHAFMAIFGTAAGK
jgi:hypothetical protein